MKVLKLDILALALKITENVIIMLCFTILALHFGKWWIALFAFFLMRFDITIREVVSDEQS